MSSQTPDKSSIDAAARTFMERSSAPGLAIGIVTPDSTKVFSYGVASKETGNPVDERTVFEIGSISKTFTAALAAYAAESGALTWNASPSRYISELKGSALDRVSLLNLATHTTGGMPLQLPDDVKTNADLTAYFRRWIPPSQPGTVRTYANPSIGLLGVVTARAMKGRFAALVRERITRPLGLQHTFHDVPKAEQEHYAQGYTAGRQAGQGLDSSSGHGSLWRSHYSARSAAVRGGATRPDRSEPHDAALPLRDAGRSFPSRTDDAGADLGVVSAPRLGRRSRGWQRRPDGAQAHLGYAA
ncbi:serine hydrolase [Micromonospora sp. STR1s_5]|nr:serine hydrolase [Micromonospora sp. STR1s_5]